ncbi:MAG: Holliday junction branch migration protein RuvA [Chloroflexota bacterium]|nr:Holliday junction branch migration protein RuvA [Chloroflexota bacterium]
MLAGVTGVLETFGEDWVRIRIGGFLIHVAVPTSLVSKLEPVGELVSLHTHLRIREDQVTLYGFASADELDTFILLQSVSGIGPRNALGLLSTLGSNGLRTAVEVGDTVALSSAPGIGKRTASRIVLDLKGKLEVDVMTGLTTAQGNESEVVESLIALGYSSNEARRVVAGSDMSSAGSLEEKIRIALQNISGG